MHLDVKPANIFIAPSSYMEVESLFTHLKSVKEFSYDHLAHLSDLEPKLISGAWKLKLGDFGHCCKIDSWSSYDEEGDTRYCAAELIGDSNPNLPSADIFSLGASVYELCTGVILPDSGDGTSRWRDIRSGRLHLLEYDEPSFSSAGVEVSEDDGEVSTTLFSKNLISCIYKVRTIVLK